MHQSKNALIMFGRFCLRYPHGTKTAPTALSTAKFVSKPKINSERRMWTESSSSFRADHQRPPNPFNTPTTTKIYPAIKLNGRLFFSPRRQKQRRLAFFEALLPAIKITQQKCHHNQSKRFINHYNRNKELHCLLPLSTKYQNSSGKAFTKNKLKMPSTNNTITTITTVGLGLEFQGDHHEFTAIAVRPAAHKGRNYNGTLSKRWRWRQHS